MPPPKTLPPKTPPSPWPFALIGAVIILAPATAAAGNSASSVVEAILGTRAATGTDDLNADGVTDVADFFSEEIEVGDGIGFAQSDSVFDEGAGTVTIPILLGAPWNGTLNYTIGGSATEGGDFAGGARTVAISGDRALLTIPLLDDRDVEANETIVITMEPTGLGNPALRAPAIHTVQIADNDAIWEGVLQSDFARLPVTLEIVEDASGVSGHVMSDGGGPLPEGTYGLATIRRSNDSFFAESEPIPMGATGTRFGGASFNRTLSFEVDPDTRDLDAILPGFLQGRFEDRVTAVEANRAYLNRTITGQFVLQRRTPVVPVETPVLETLP
ncbi:MAG: hypothetical protein RLY93_00995 [Sumerlaeia bacterium]